MEKPTMPKSDFETLQTRGIDLFNDAKGAWEILRDRWKKSNDLYDGKFSDEESEYSRVLGIKRMFIKKTWAQIQRILSDCMEAVYFDPDELVTLIENKAVPAASQRIFKTLINHRLRGNPINYYQECYEAFLDAIKNKYCVIKTYPRLKIKLTKKKTVIDETGENLSPEDYDKEVEYFCPAMEVLPYEDVFFSKRATWKDFYKFPIIHRKRISRGEALDRGWKVEDEESAGMGTDEIKEQRQEFNGSPFAKDPEGNKDLDQLWSYEIWDFKRRDGELESGSFVMIGSSESPEKVVRGWEWNEMPYKYDELEPRRPPFDLGVSLPRAHTLPGDDFPEVTEGLQQETNSQRNQEREAVALALRPPLIVMKDSGMDLFSLMTRRIGAVMQSEVPPEQAARELQMQNPVSLTAPIQQRTDNDYAEVSSITPMSLGMSRGSDMPATNFAGLSGNTNKKIQFIMRNVLITGIFPALDKLMRLEQAYETDDYIEQVTGERLGLRFEKDQNGYVGASPSATIQGRYAFNIQIGVNKQAQMGQWKTIIELINQANATAAQLVQMGVAQPQTVQFWKADVAIEELMKTMGQKNIDEMKIQAVQPPPQEGGGAGFASQPSLAGPVNPAQEAMLAG